MWLQDNAIFVVLGVVVFLMLMVLGHLSKHGSLSKDSECPFWDDGELEWNDGKDWKKYVKNVKIYNKEKPAIAGFSLFFWINLIDFLLLKSSDKHRF